MFKEDLIVDWVEVIDMDVFFRDFGFNVLICVVGGGFDIFFGWLIKIWI